jgi:ketosteroid isomerase-like protein
MRKYLSVIPLVLLLCFVVGCQQATKEPALDIGEEREALSKTIAAWNNANNSSDLEAMLASVAEDALFSRGGAEFMNKTELGEFWSNQFSQGVSWTSYPPEKLEISASGDLAYAACRYEFIRAIEGESKTSRHTYTSVWKKQADGSWKMVSW